MIMPPHNTQAEGCLLGDLLQKGSCDEDIGNYLKQIKEEDFYNENNLLVFRTMRSLFDKKINVDIQTVFTELHKIKSDVDLSYLAELGNLTPTTSHIDSHCKQVRNIAIRRKIFIKSYELLDIVNKENQTGDELLEKAKGMFTMDDSLGTFKHISTKDKVQRARDELTNTNPNKIIKWGWYEWDSLLGGIYGGKIYVIGADTGIGKSTFINQVCKNITRQGERVVKYSLEDRMEDIGKEEIFYTINKLRFKDKQSKYNWVDFVNNEYGHSTGRLFDPTFNSYVGMACTILEKEKIIELDKQKQVNINDLCRLMEQECKKGTRFFAIDHLHYFEMKKTERHDLEIQNVMHKINEIARIYNVAVFLIAHYKYRQSGQKHNNDSFKDGSSIKQVANIIIHIRRDINEEDGNTEFEIGKLRGPIRPRIITARFDINKFEYEFIKTEKQKKHELNF